MSRTAWLGMQDPLKHMLSAFVGTNAGIGNTCQQTSNLKPPSVPLVFTCGLNVTGNSTGAQYSQSPSGNNGNGGVGGNGGIASGRNSANGLNADGVSNGNSNLHGSYRSGSFVQQIACRSTINRNMF